MGYVETFISLSEKAKKKNLTKLSNVLINLSSLGETGNSFVTPNDFDLYISMSNDAIKQKNKVLEQVIYQMVIYRWHTKQL